MKKYTVFFTSLLILLVLTLLKLIHIEFPFSNWFLAIAFVINLISILPIIGGIQFYKKKKIGILLLLFSSFGFAFFAILNGKSELATASLKSFATLFSFLYPILLVGVFIRIFVSKKSMN